MKAAIDRRWLAWILGSAGVVASCELVVPKANLDDVRCEREGMGAPDCPDGKVCFSGRCLFVGDVVDASDEAARPEAGGSAGDSQPDGFGGTGGVDASEESAGSGTGGVAVPDAAEEEAAKPPADLGQPCVVDTDCKSSLCLDVPGSPGNRACSKFCCTSMNCPSGTVCANFFGSGLCVSASFAQLPTPGTGVVGDSCSAVGAEACRSSRCGIEGTCKDACCADSSCPGGVACSLTAEFGQSGWFCASSAAGTKGADGAGCTQDNECDANNCQVYTLGGNYCGGPCCSSDDCAVHGWGAFCDYALRGSTPVRQCFGPIKSKPNAGPACCNDTNCDAGQRCVAVESEIASDYSWLMDRAVVFRCQ